MSDTSQTDLAPDQLANSGHQADASNEARQFPRFPFRGRAQAVVFAPPSKPGMEPQEWEVLTTDLSRGGLSILHRKQLHHGQRVQLVLNGTDQLVEVCWCCRVWTGLYAAGCRFVSAAADA